MDKRLRTQLQEGVRLGVPRHRGRKLLNAIAGEAAGEKEPEAYPLGYVEDFFDTRTKLAVVFSSLP